MRELHALMSQASDAVMISDARGRVTWVNPAWERMTGYTMAQIVGRTASSLLRHNDVEPTTAQAIRHAVRNGLAYQGELRNHRADGSPFWTRISLTPIRDDHGELQSFICVKLDITAQRSREAQIRALIQHAATVIIGLYPDGTIFEWNDAAATLFGIPRDHVVGRALWDQVACEDDREAVRRAIARVLEGDALRGIHQRLRSRTGATIRVRWNVSTFANDAGEIAGVIAVGDDVTERYAAQERFRVLFEHSSDSHILFAGHILHCNDATVRMLRAPNREALIGVHPATLSPPLQPDGEPSEEKARRMIELAHAKRHHRFDWLHRRLDGTDVFVEVSLASITLDGRPTLIGVWRDLTQRMGAEEALRRERARLVDAVELLDSSFAMFDAEDRLLVCNSAFVFDRPQWEALARPGVPLRALLEATLVDGKVPETGESGEAWIARAMERHRGEGETFVQVVGDRTLRVTVQPTSDGGSVSLATDISPLMAVQRSLEQARDAADEANRAKSDFLARMSHELRTPLNAIIGFTRLMARSRDTFLPEREREFLSRVEANGSRLLALVNDILDLAKVEAGRVDVQRAPTDICTLVTETVAQCEGYPRRPEVVLRTDVPSAPATLVTDGAKLRQVLVNLISNALKFTERGEVVVRVVTNAAQRPLLVEVHDTGCGIPPHRLGAIFEAFEQADATTGRDYGGTGLGLSISRALCLAIGARLSVESAPGEGSTFRVVLPAA
ncbi:MAG: PAS domain S-box protein [Gemmatimonadaceae bacterium]|nr:PAS domain S-box protein [Gemmatimonadaceae bacterium]